jgi:isoleucyl-tRNA synthetase
MNFHAEARIAGELLKIAKSGQLYRGSKPVMWSVVERTALAEAEVEYADVESDMIWVKFPVVDGAADLYGQLCRHLDDDPLDDPRQPCRRVFARAYPYGLYRGFESCRRTTFGPQPGEKLIFADKLAEDASARAKITMNRIRSVSAQQLESLTLSHPLAGLGATSPFEGRGRAEGAGGGVGAEGHPTSALRADPPPEGEGGGYAFPVPLLDGDHVTDDAGTGFVHTAPSHGREDFEAWTANARQICEARGISSNIPFPVDDAGFYTTDAPVSASTAQRVSWTTTARRATPTSAVIKALIASQHAVRARAAEAPVPAFLALQEAGHLPQHAAVVRPHGQGTGRVHLPLEGGGRARMARVGVMRRQVTPPRRYGPTLPLKGRVTRCAPAPSTPSTTPVSCPPPARTRLRAMIEERPDWVLSRQRAWGVPICVFVDEDGEVLQDEAVNGASLEAFEAEGADAWFAEGAKERFLGNDHDGGRWKQVKDILDVWFDSGSTHTFTLEDRPT